MILINNEFYLLFVFGLFFLLLAFYQAKLYQKQKKTAEREALLRTTVETIRKTLDIKQIKRTVVTEVGKVFGAMRVFMIDLDVETGKAKILDEYSEYLASPEEVSYVGFDFTIPEFDGLASTYKNGKIIVVEDKEEFNKFIYEFNVQNTPFGKAVLASVVQSGITSPIIYEGQLYSTLTIQYKEKRHFTEDEIEFIYALGNQVGLAIYQARLYEKQKEAAEREALLRTTVETIRKTLDIKQVKKTIVTEVAKVFGAMRVFMIDLDIETGKAKLLDEYSEYLTSPDEVSYVGFDFNAPEFVHLANTYKNGEIITLENKEEFNKFIYEFNLQNTPYGKAVLASVVQSGITSPIIYEGQLYSTLTIQYKEKKHFTEDEIEFIHALGNQVGLALYQARLYQKQKETAEREALLRNTVETIRSTLDIEEIKNKIVTEIGKLLKADRVFIVEYDSKNKRFLPITQNSEYLSSQKIKSMIGLNVETLEELSFIKSAHATGLDLIYPNIDKLLEKEKTENVQVINFIKNFSIASSIIINITYGEEFLGNLVIHYNQEKEYFAEDDLQYLKTIANQIGIGIYQSVLFSRVKQQAQKESILRHIISEIKLSSSLEQAYLMLLEELSKIYNLNRVLFLESSPHNRTDLIIKSEFIVNDSKLQVNNLIFPQVCINDFLNLINNFETLVINNVLDCYPDEETMKFFRKYKIQSLMAAPLVKQNKNITVFGFIILCGEDKREWSIYEIELLKSISESVISVLWEICKFNEIEDLRNSFVLTLAHDFQVPLIGERNALEYLIKYASEKIGADASLLSEILENNNNIILLLEKSVDIYNYESGKKELNFNVYNIKVLLKEAVEYIKEYATSKSVSLELNCKDKHLFVNVDKFEILKVFHTIIENAIEKSPENSKVLINVHRKMDDIEISIKDFGPGIPKEIQEKIFNRYEMALAIERKIGAGTGLFLSKRIIEAHKGKIYFDTTLKKGTAFYIILPVEDTA